jgi:hypothetical protein
MNFFFIRNSFGVYVNVVYKNLVKTIASFVLTGRLWESNVTESFLDNESLKSVELIEKRYRGAPSGLQAIH